MFVADAPTRPVRSADESPIFVVGTGRSGTTLLRQMLNAHPRIHITHEAGFYTYALHAPAYVTGSEWLERYFETFSFAWLRVDPERVRAQLPRELPRERIAEAYQAVMREKARLAGKPRHGEKNPLDTQNLGRIFHDFPDARVVYVTRDPRPTVVSFNRVPFSTPSVMLNAFLCAVQFWHVRPFLDRVLEVRLEDLTADTERTMAGVLRFVGEPYDDAVLDHVRRAPVDDVPPLPWFLGATREGPSRKQSEGSWREQLTPAWIRLIERINRTPMERYGYAAAELLAEPGLWAQVKALLRDAPGMARTAERLFTFKNKLYRHFEDIERLDTQQAMEESIDINPAAWRHYPGFVMPQVPRPVLSCGPR